MLSWLHGIEPRNASQSRPSMVPRNPTPAFVFDRMIMDSSPPMPVPAFPEGLRPAKKAGFLPVPVPMGGNEVRDHLLEWWRPVGFSGAMDPVHPMFNGTLFLEGMIGHQVAGLQSGDALSTFGFRFEKGLLLAEVVRDGDEPSPVTWLARVPQFMEGLNLEKDRTPFDLSFAFEAVSRTFFGVSLPGCLFDDQALAHEVLSARDERSHLDERLKKARATLPPARLRL